MYLDYQGRIAMGDFCDVVSWKAERLFNMKFVENFVFNLDVVLIVVKQVAENFTHLFMMK
jgi:hypothetical protein